MRPSDRNAYTEAGRDFRWCARHTQPQAYGFFAVEVCESHAHPTTATTTITTIVTSATALRAAQRTRS
jgi:hypothetical protein